MDNIYCTYWQEIKILFIFSQQKQADIASAFGFDDEDDD